MMVICWLAAIPVLAFGYELVAALLFAAGCGFGAYEIRTETVRRRRMDREGWTRNQQERN